MKYIDEKFKDADPRETVARIKDILNSLGIEVYENWYDSGLENCYSLRVYAEGGVPASNGKGVTKEFARASAYGEFIERLQGGLHLYKYQSIIRDSDMDIQTFAPDAKYMTVEELESDGEWMDRIIEEYKYPDVTRKTIVELCRIYACADDGKILTLPFFSLFEKKYVYLPIAFVDHIYSTNGCCVGNTRNEAWVHALSEIMERHANLEVFTKGVHVQKFSSEIIDRFPVVSKIIKSIRESGDFDIDVFDYSLDFDFPIVATRIINKKTHSYSVKVAADPILEIALERNLTELFQGKNLYNFTSQNSGTVLKKINDFPVISNITNQLETGNGVYTADYFADNHVSSKAFTDNSDKNNRQLLDYILNIFRKNNNQIYVRNFSYLGFPCYRFVIPGFSEAFALRLCEPVHEYSVGDMVSKTLRNPLNSTDEDLNWLLMYSNMIKSTIGRYNYFGRLSGVPLTGNVNSYLSNITRAYASYRLGNYNNAIKYLSNAIVLCDDSKKEYLECVNKYLELKKISIDDEKIRTIIYKFFVKSIADELYYNIDNGGSPFDDLLLNCNYPNCDNCKYRQVCCYDNAKQIHMKIGNIYRRYKNGQDESEFSLD